MDELGIVRGTVSISVNLVPICVCVGVCVCVYVITHGDNALWLSCFILEVTSIVRCWGINTSLLDRCIGLANLSLSLCPSLLPSVPLSLPLSPPLSVSLFSSLFLLPTCIRCSVTVDNWRWTWVSRGKWNGWYWCWRVLTHSTFHTRSVNISRHNYLKQYTYMYMYLVEIDVLAPCLN